MKDLAITARRIFFGQSRKILLTFLCLVLVTGFSLTLSQRAWACAPCSCVSVNHAITRGVVLSEHLLTQEHIRIQFERHREEFFVYYFFKEHVLAAMMMMTEQLVGNAMNQMFIVGAFFDAKEQLETQQLFQQLAAEAHKNYQPSVGMCEIGTLSRSLAASQRHGEFNGYFLSQYMQDRQMRTLPTSAAAGRALEVNSRWLQWKETFCNPHDNDGWLGPRSSDPICTGTPVLYRNADVDFTTTIGHPTTVNVDFSEPGTNQANEAVFGLTGNLYGNDVFAYFPEAFFKNEENEDEYMYVRSIVAKRSVAQNSFNALVALKSRGKIETEELAPYMQRLMEQLGLPATEAQQYFATTRPSYYAEMELLTKKLYQRPEFYTNLYDKPINVERKRAAMQAIGLMQNMDLYKSKLRTEASLAVLTELEIFKQQEEVQNRIGGARDTGLK